MSTEPAEKKARMPLTLGYWKIRGVRCTRWLLQLINKHIIIYNSVNSKVQILPQSREEGMLNPYLIEPISSADLNMEAVVLQIMFKYISGQELEH